MNYLGNRLFDDLYGSSVEVVFGIDIGADGIEYDIPIYKMESLELAEKLTCGCCCCYGNSFLSEYFERFEKNMR